jgi:ribosomal protein S18 acetylase RimI-like enzyme
VGIAIRRIDASDRTIIEEMLRASCAFSSEEISVALQLVDETLADPTGSGYDIFVSECGGLTCGYVCVGATPLTQSTWDLYWICVHPEMQHRGAGQALERHAADFIRSSGGQRIVVETSGRPDYEPARRFYEKAGYFCAGRIVEYYKPGDDCIFYCKVLVQ